MIDIPDQSGSIHILFDEITERRIHLVFLVMIVLFGISSAAEPEIIWSSTYSSSYDDRAWDIEITDDGGVIVAGESTAPEGEFSTFRLIKYDPLGNLCWEREFALRSANSGQAVIQIPGGYISAGWTGSPGLNDRDGLIVKTDYFGDLLVKTTIGGSGSDAFYDIQITHDGGFILAGQTRSTGAGEGDFWLVRLNEECGVIWNRNYGTSGPEAAYSVYPTSDGGYIVAGGGSDNFMLVKTDEQGRGQWSSSYDNGNFEVARCVRETSDGGFILIGLTRETERLNSRIWLVKASHDGEYEWGIELGDGEQNYGWCVEEMMVGGFCIVGNSLTEDNRFDAFIFRTDESGNIIWTVQLGGPEWDNICALAMDEEESFALAGRTFSHLSQSFDVWIVRMGQEDLLDWK